MLFIHSNEEIYYKFINKIKKINFPCLAEIKNNYDEEFDKFIIQTRKNLLMDLPLNFYDDDDLKVKSIKSF